MVSWLTHIIGSCGNSRRNRPGDRLRGPPLAEPRRYLVDKWLVIELVRLRALRATLGSLVSSPRPILASTAVGGNLARHSRDGAPE